MTKGRTIEQSNSRTFELRTRRPTASQPPMRHLPHFVVRLFDCSAVRLFLLLLLATQGAMAQSTQPSVAVQLGVDREAIYQYETFMLTVKVVSSGIRLGTGLTLGGMPDAGTLTMGPIEDLPIQRSLKGRTILETRHYRARCRALKPGRVRLAPSVAATHIVQRRSFFGRQWVEQPLSLPVDPLVFSVSALPAPPAGLRASGAVGRFAFEALPVPLDVAVGDLIKVGIRITGDGYLDTVSCPAIGPDAGFKVYPPRLLERDKTGVEFEQVLIPLSSDADTIPPLRFTSFDARSGTYHTQTQGPYQVTFHAKHAIDRSQQYRPVGTAPVGDGLVSTDADAALRDAPSHDAAAIAAHVEAVQAYASGYFEAALAAYAGLTNAAPAWLQYNRGVVHLSAGAYGKAIAQLLRSRRAEPGAVDTARVLEQTCRAAGVPLPNRMDGWPQRLRRYPHWNRAAIMAAPATARLAPADRARALFACKEGALVTIEERSGSWLSVRRGRAMGWIPAGSVIELAATE